MSAAMIAILLSSQPILAAEFIDVPPIPWEANCRVVGKSATPRVVCEGVIVPQSDEKNKTDRNKSRKEKA